MKQLEGLWTALVTPFKDGKVDFEGLRQLIHLQLEQQVDGLLVLGTTGEAPTLTEEEKQAIITLAVKETRGAVPLMVGTGSYSTEQTIKQTRLAQALGADIALVVTPYYNCPMPEGIYLHFEALAKAVEIPLCLYNIPKRTGKAIDLETVVRIGELPGFVGIKDCSADMGYLSDLLAHFRKADSSFAVMSGDDLLALPMMALGCKGLISVISNLIPKQMAAFLKTLQKMDFTSAQNMHRTLLPLFKAAGLETNPIPIKAALEMAGLPSGPCRLPLAPLSYRNQEKLRQVLEEFGLLNLTHSKVGCC